MLIRSWFALLIFMCLAACTGRVTDSVSTTSDTIEQLARQSSLSLISNSTPSEPTCATTNSIVLQIALSNLSTFYCRDTSKLMTAVRTGPVCDGSVSVATFPVSSAVVSCQQITVCGKPATSSSIVAQRIDGTPVRQLTFTDLPWGCEVHVEASTDSGFPADQTQIVAAQILPPTCPYCVSAGKVTCGTCTAVDPATTMIVAGQPIPKTCSGACTCTSGGVTFNHGDTKPFFTTSNSGCGQTCAQVQTTRVCNGGSWVPGADSSFVSQCQEPPPTSCTAPAPGSFASTKFVDKLLSYITAPKGQSSLTATAATCASCQAGGCATCTTSNGTSGFLLYKSTSVPAGSKCSDISLCEACSADGKFQGDNAYTYGACATLGSGCTATAITGTVGSGTTQAFFNNTSSGCTEYDLVCTSGVWYDANGVSFPQATVNTYANKCIKATDCTTLGGVKITNNTSAYVYTTAAVDAGQSCYTNAISLSCSNGTIAPADPGATYKYSACSIKSCPDPSDPAGLAKINAGVKKTIFSQLAANCAAANPATDCAAHSVSLDCGTTGGTATVTPATTDFSSFKYGNCTLPPSCTQCAVSTQDAGTVYINVSTTATTYKAATATYCSSIAATFTCNPGTGTNPPTLTGAGGALLSDYRYYNCTGSGNDQGNGGGTGGGTGNDDGPGSAFRKRVGAGDGGGGPGSGCIDATTCNSQVSLAVPPTTVKFIPCQVPWGIGEVEFYGAFNAFSRTGATLVSGTTDTVCVTKPDTCTNHRQLRACHYPTLSGGTDYAYPNCVEKASCP